MKRRWVWILLVCLALGAVLLVNQRDSVERALIRAIDRKCEMAGECEIDLAEIFTDFEWDTAAIFIAGNPREVEEALDVYSEISDGIVFLRNGDVQRVHMSAYGFPQDVPPDISYYLGDDLRGKCYVCMPRERAIVRAEKYAWNGGWKYNICPI